MKHTKKILSILLTLCLVFSLSVTAFAKTFTDASNAAFEAEYVHIPAVANIVAVDEIATIDAPLFEYFFLTKYFASSTKDM